MAAKSIDKNYDHFSDVINESLKMLMAIEGYENKPLVSLEEAIRPLISILPDITLQVLYIESNTFEMNSIINMLEHNHSLKKVYIKNSNRISDVCKEKLRKAIEFKPDFDIFI